MDRHLASWMTGTNQTDRVSPRINFVDRSTGKIEVTGLASPFSMLRYVLAPLEELFAVSRRGQGPNDDQIFTPLLRKIEQAILEAFDDNWQLTDADVTRAIDRLCPNPHANVSADAVAISIQLNLRLMLSLDDFSREDVCDALQHIAKRVARHSMRWGPTGYLMYARVRLARMGPQASAGMGQFSYAGG